MYFWFLLCLRYRKYFNIKGMIRIKERILTTSRNYINGVNFSYHLTNFFTNIKYIFLIHTKTTTAFL
jgi:hypothetical protein